LKTDGDTYRIHFFLWLLSKNKLLTRDNLDKKKRKVEDKTCLFCEELESVHHLFFECVVAKQSWSVVSVVVGFQIGADFESMAKCWLCNTKFSVVNMLSSAVCWSIWRLRNMLCFQGVACGYTWPTGHAGPGRPSPSLAGLVPSVAWLGTAQNKNGSCCADPSGLRRSPGTAWSPLSGLCRAKSKSG
jgi:hypothetical protein